MAKGTKDELVAEAKLRREVERAREAIQIPDPWKPMEAGEEVVGKFVESRKIKCRDKQGRDRTPTVFILTNAAGDRFSVWGSANLQPQMDKAEVAGLKVGQVVAVTYDGETETSGGFKVKLYVLTVISE